MALYNIGNPLTGWNPGSHINIQFGSNNTGSSSAIDVSNHEKIVIQWVTTGSSAGSIMGCNDNSNWVVLDARNFNAPGTVLVGLEDSSVPKYIRAYLGSNQFGSFTGSITSFIYAR